jgi:hypothetical protein
MLAMPALDAALSPMDLSVDHGTGCLKLMLAYMFIICQRAQLLLPHHMCPDILLAVVSVPNQLISNQIYAITHHSMHAYVYAHTHSARKADRCQMDQQVSTTYRAKAYYLPGFCRLHYT